MRSMQIMRKLRKCFGRTVQTVLSAFLVLQLLVLLALAACPSLHHALHHDSDQPGHDCLVTAFVKGQVGEAVLPLIVTFFAAFLICAGRLPGLPLRLSFEYRFAPGRGPPLR